MLSPLHQLLREFALDAVFLYIEMMRKTEL
jgi:hypothetical protein